jgi:hypothetical protein
MPGMSGRGSFTVFALPLVACAAWLCPGDARAQDIPFDSAIDVQLFEYAPGTHSFLTVPDADIVGQRQFTLDFLVTFLTDPFTIYNVDEVEDEIVDQRTEVVGQVLAGQLGGAYGLRDSLQLSASVPLVFSMSGDGLDLTMASAGDGLQASGLGDLRVELAWRFYQTQRLRLAVVPGLTMPTSFGTDPGDDDGVGGGAFLGDNLPSGRVRVAAKYTPSRRLALGAFAGAILRKPREIYSSEIGQQLTYGVAANVTINDRVAGIAEVFGRSGFNTDVDASPMEAVGGLRIRATGSVSVLVGGGAGVVRGIGAPGLRVFASVGWAPDYRDSDGDGVANQDDTCPLVEEDRDGFEDSDGCPDDDNDGDKREDAIDKCPLKPEDLDGFDDEDGCPELDNDNDGFLDADDRCPIDREDGKAPFDKDGCPAGKRDSDDDGIADNRDQCPDEFEDADGFEDWDGCPDVDNDGDDLPDEFDECPLCREDVDGFKDDDGCPEPDNDGDGVPDASDKCADESEVINGVDDFDGCPDGGGAMSVSLDGDRVTIDAEIDFSRADGLSRRGRGVVDQLAGLALSHPEITRWRVVASAPRKGSDEQTRAASQRRAHAVRDHMVSRGVEARRIEAIGAVADRAVVAMVALERAEGDFMCPASAEAVERQPSSPPPQPAASESSFEDR